MEQQQLRNIKCGGQITYNVLNPNQLIIDDFIAGKSTLLSVHLHRKHIK